MICSDKTGTLTQNQMTVTRGWAGGHGFAVTGEGYTPEGEFSRGVAALASADDPGTSLLLHGMMLCWAKRLCRCPAEVREEIPAANKGMATSALRALGADFMSLKEVPEEPKPETLERHLTFLGLESMIDPA